MNWEHLNDFLQKALIPGLPLQRWLILFAIFLIGIRFLPEFARKLTLLLTSVALIEMATSPFYTFLLVIYAGVIYYVLFWLQWSSKKKIYCSLLGILTVSVFFILKDVPFFDTSFTGKFIHQFGISLFALRMLSVIVETGRGNPLPTDPLDYFIYQFFTPTFFQGPLERLVTFKENLKEPEAFDVADMGSQLIRLGCGLAKAWVVVHYLEQDVSGWLSFYLPLVKVYLMLSAMSDFTIAACGLAGYRLHENFDYPFLKTSLTQFWHSTMTPLHEWFRDYVYIPLGGKQSLYRNLVISFVCVGLWYELSVPIILCALWQATGLYISKKYEGYWQHLPKPLAALIVIHYMAAGFFFWKHNFLLPL